jgi:GGDEF domain-containing protein
MEARRFLSLLPALPPPKTAVEIARRMCQEPLQVNAYAFGDIEIPVTVSIGISSTADVGFDMAALIVAADEELYRAKRPDAISRCQKSLQCRCARILRPNPIVLLANATHLPGVNGYNLPA